jgi:putative membrane protein
VRGIEVEGVAPLLFAAAMIGIINAIVRPVVFLLTLPLTVVTFGLFILVLNAAMLVLASVFVPGFVVHGFWAALFGWLLLSFFTFCINVLIGEHGSVEVVHFRY